MSAILARLAPKGPIQRTEAQDPAHTAALQLQADSFRWKIHAQDIRSFRPEETGKSVEAAIGCSGIATAAMTVCIQKILGANKGGAKKVGCRITGLFLKL